MSDGKKILDDLENGKLPDIKTDANKKSKDLIRVRYSRPVEENIEAPMRNLTTRYSVFKYNEPKKQENKTGGVATKERKKEKAGEQ